MKGTEFIDMMRQDIVTVEANKHDLEAVVECMAAVVAANPGCDIQDDGTKPKTPQGCYKYLEDNARQNKGSANKYFMGPEESLRLVAKYLGLGENQAPKAVMPQAKVISLDDLI